MVSVQRHKDEAPHVDKLLQGLGSEMAVFMSHGDKLSKLPEGFLTIATTGNSPYAGIVSKTKPWFGIQASHLCLIRTTIKSKGIILGSSTHCQVPKHVL